jgi:membrane-bound ClpP family serine protease
MAKKKITRQPEQADDSRMPLSRRNYILMLVGLGIIIIGFVLMAGGGSDDPAVFNYDMFSWRRTTLAPIIVVAGFAFEVYAIMKKDKKKQ